MKTLLIVALSLALLAAAFLTRPGRRELALYVMDTRMPSDGQWAASDFHNADGFLRSVQIKDRWIYVDVERDGKLIYTGAFAHFIPRGEQVQNREGTLSTADLAKFLATRN